MKDVHLVRDVHDFTHLSRDTSDLPRGQTTAFLEDLAEGLTNDDLHHQIMQPALVHPGIVDAHNAWMVNSAHRRGLSKETAQDIGVTGAVSLEDLDGDQAIIKKVITLHHLTGSASPQQGENPITPRDVPWQMPWDGFTPLLY